MFLDKISIWIDRLKKVVRAWIEQKSRGRLSSFCLIVEVGCGSYAFSTPGFRAFRSGLASTPLAFGPSNDITGFPGFPPYRQVVRLLYNFVLFFSVALKSLSGNSNICQPSVDTYCLHAVWDLSDSCCDSDFLLKCDIFVETVSWLFDTIWAVEGRGSASLVPHHSRPWSKSSLSTRLFLNHPIRRGERCLITASGNVSPGSSHHRGSGVKSPVFLLGL